MRTLVAHAFDADTPDEVTAGRARVDAWYAPLWGVEPVRRSHTVGGLGLHMWDHPDEQCRWPTWQPDGDDVVATVGVPLGYDRLVASDPAEAPRPLATQLETRPEQVLELAGPFVLARVEQAARRLTLWTDALGTGRLYELRTPNGYVWSNRPVAALRFAGVRAEADPLGWLQLAACDWAMGDVTAYAGVRAVPAATCVDVGAWGYRRSSVDLLASLSSARSDPLAAESVASTAEALLSAARSVERLWPGRPAVNLSGGRDSRLVAAALLAAGAEPSFRTFGGLDGEVETARALIAALRGHHEHTVTTPSAQRPERVRAGALERARAWHDVAEGLRPATYLRNLPPRSLPHSVRPQLSGVGGELAHGHFYPPDVDRLEGATQARRIEAFTQNLLARVLLPRGLSREAMAAVEVRAREVLSWAVDHDVSDSTALDWFYLDERLRRWGMAGESGGKVLPLLTPAFIASSFALSTEQSRTSALPRALTAALVPQWADIPYYRGSLKKRSAVRQQRLWEEPDRDLLTALIADPTEWGDAFEVAEVQHVWRQALAGAAAARDELLLQRVVWRAGFADHLRAVNGEPELVRHAAVPDLVPQPARRDLHKVARALAVRANNIPLARRLARTPFARRLRRRIGV